MEGTNPHSKTVVQASSLAKVKKKEYLDISKGIGCNPNASWTLSLLAGEQARRLRYSGCVFKIKLNTLPLPGILRAEIVPLCASMICLQMASPKPVPPGELRERSLSTR